jgi:predicted enzyme related to lactoylglutathione lyase
MPPRLTNGKVYYIEIPAIDIQRSADFYSKVFGWQINRRADGSTAFDDTTGEVSGTWVVARAPSAEPGTLMFIMVDSIAATVDAIIAQGGEIVQAEGGEIVQSIGAATSLIARFHDPAGNVFGLFQIPDQGA